MDTIEGVVSSLSSTRTLNPVDEIDGGAGTDTLNLDLQSTFNGFTGDGFLKNVEIVNLTNTGTISRSFAAKEVEGVEVYNLKGIVSLSDLADTDAAINIADRASGTTTIAYADEVTDGTADALVLGLSNVGVVEVKNAAGTVTTSEVSLTVTAAAIEEVNITATGANVVAFGSNDAKSISVAGAGSLKLTAIGSGIKSIDGSLSTGKIDVDLDDASGVTSVVLGSADDVIRAQDGDLTINAEINGGEGSDKLILTGNIGTVQYRMGGVETLELDGATTVFSSTNVNGLENLLVKGGGNAVTIANLGSADINVTLSKDADGDVSSDHSGSTGLTVSGGTKAAVQVNLVNTALTGSTDVTLKVEKFNTLGDGTNGNVTATKAITFAADIIGGIDNTITLAAATSVVLNQTNKDTTAAIVLDASKAVNLQVTTAGTFTLDGNSDLSGLESLSVSVANKAFDATGVALGAAAGIELSGTGSNAKITLDDIGSATADFGITLTAEGLADDLTVGTIDTAEGQNVVIDVAGVLGAVAIGSVTVDQNTVGGSITINANGTVGAVELGTLTAKVVNVNAAGALDTVGVAASVAIDAVTATFIGSALAANDVIAMIDTTGTIVGGIDIDTIAIIADAATTKVSTVTITGGLGVDIFNIDFTTNANHLGALRAIITDFNNGGVEKLDGDFNGLKSDALDDALDDGAELLAARTTLKSFLEDALGGTVALTAITNVLSLELLKDDGSGTDFIFQFGGSTHIVIDGDGDGAAFGDGDAFVTLTGIKGVNTEALANALFA